MFGSTRVIVAHLRASMTAGAHPTSMPQLAPDADTTITEGGEK
jgi:hypothetical protein